MGFYKRYEALPALAIDKPVVRSAFSKIEIGTLLLKPSLKSSVSNGGEYSARKANVIARVEIVLGEFACADLTAFFRSQTSNGITLFSSISGAVTSVARTKNTLSNSLLSISAHYDISNDMFAAFIDGAKIKSTDHVLEIGTGWGLFVIEAVRKRGCRRQIEQTGFSDGIDVKLEEYLNLPVPAKPYDKIFSIEMLEATGGIATFQCITMPEEQHEAYSKSEDFTNKHIFPGSYPPSTTQLLNPISRESGEAEHPYVTDEEIEVFRRKGEYDFTYCEAGFVAKTLGDVTITVRREDAMNLMEDIPV
ncbi:cyclopropane-fatty-acyl-phospholipid synthase [Xylariaceae sp. FL0662B]|nr:cyclopropane-fatty-acyl-phospholipid synthase [Xylariaceae sp. FL0662B]